MATCQLASRVPLKESVLLFHEVVTVIFSEGLHQPHNFTVDCCCSTILLLITAGRRIWACDNVTNKQRERTKDHFFMLADFAGLKVSLKWGLTN